MKRSRLLTIVLIVMAYFIGYTFGIGNQEQKFGSTGFPKNCRALIAANVRGYQLGQYKADEALGSIDRNCGAFGLIWNER